MCLRGRDSYLKKKPQTGHKKPKLLEDDNGNDDEDDDQDDDNLPSTSKGKISVAKYGRVIYPKSTLKKSATPKKQTPAKGCRRQQDPGVETLFAKPRKILVKKVKLGPRAGWGFGVEGSKACKVDPKTLLKSHIKKKTKKKTPQQPLAQPGPGGDATPGTSGVTPGRQSRGCSGIRGRGRGSTAGSGSGYATPRGRGNWYFWCYYKEAVTGQGGRSISVWSSKCNCINVCSS